MIMVVYRLPVTGTRWRAGLGSH